MIAARLSGTSAARCHVLPVAAIIAAALCAAAELASADGYRTPVPGDAARTDILDALRPMAEWAFGPPVEFVVGDLRVAEDVAFVAVMAQRPGGGAIAIADAPLVTRDGAVPELVDGAVLQALLVKSGAMWVPVQHAVGPTDVWYAWDGYCPVWGIVLPESCPPG